MPSALDTDRDHALDQVQEFEEPHEHLAPPFKVPSPRGSQGAVPISFHHCGSKVLRRRDLVRFAAVSRFIGRTAGQHPEKSDKFAPSG
jgi:hypothetical protein